jgi:AraC-like DNA-binding protein
MHNHVDRPEGSAGAEYVPQLFHRTDSFRFLDAGGRLAVHRMNAEQMVLARVWSTGHDIALEEPERVTLLFPWAGRITCAVQDDMIGADAGGVLAFAPNRRRTVVERPSHASYLADVLTLPLATLREVQQAEDLRPGRIAPRQDAASAAIARLRLRVGHMLSTDRAGLPCDGQVAAFNELSVDLALALADPDHGSASAGSRRVTQAIAMMRDRHAEPMSVAALARELGCSCRSLQVAFREAGHATPHEVLAGIRLDAARVRLLSGGQNVTHCAFDSGVTHLGRFAQAYRQRFGEPPGVTLAKRV